MKPNQVFLMQPNQVPNRTSTHYRSSSYCQFCGLSGVSIIVFIKWSYVKKTASLFNKITLHGLSTCRTHSLQILMDLSIFVSYWPIRNVDGNSYCSSTGRGWVKQMTPTETRGSKIFRIMKMSVNIFLQNSQSMKGAWSRMRKYFSHLD